MKLTSVIATITVITMTAFAGVAKTDTINVDGNVVTVNPNPNDLSVLYTETSRPELYCLALNIYHEARSDNLAGQFAVADVVLNRVEDKRWPNTICEVVKQGPISKWWKEEKGKEVPIRNRCQFSWWCDGKGDEPNSPLAWRKAQEIAYHIVNDNLYRGMTEGATHYHATYVDPSWNKSMVVVGRIGEHIFYKSLPK